MRFLLVGILVGCGSVHTDAPDAPPADACVPEADAAICSRLAACDPLDTTDNCGAQRHVDCGACTGTDVCVANACKAPVCGALSFPTKADVFSGFGAMSENVIAAITPDGTSLLVQSGITSLGGPPCDLGFNQLTVIDAGTQQGVTGVDNMQTALQPTLALTADGLTIIGIEVATGTHFVVARRTAKTTGAFTSASAADFAALAVTGNARLSAPVISADGLAFYFSVTGDQTAGIYETVRPSTSVPFPAATKLGGDLANMAIATAISSDHMTLFVGDHAGAFGAATRTSVTKPFTLQVGLGLPPQARMLGDCSGIYATCSVGGGGGQCAELDVCLFVR